VTHSGAPTKLLLVAVILLLAYGSLYPGNFQTGRATPSQAVTILLHSWPDQISPGVFVDMVLNLFIYLPLGLLGWATTARRSTAFRLIAVVLLGACLSSSMEFLQVYLPTRTPSLLDILTNTLGTSIGVGLGWLFTNWLRFPWPDITVPIRRSHGATLLLLLWIAAQWAPLIPGIGLYRLHHKLLQLFSIDWSRFPWEMMSAVASWTAVQLLLDTIVPGNRSWPIALPISVFAGRFLIAHQNPTAGDLAGLLLAVLVYHTLLRTFPFRLGFAAAFTLLTLLTTGLTPFQFSPTAGPFRWTPFGISLEMGNWELAGVVLLAKAFRYGAAVWLLNQCKLRLLTAAVSVALFLGAVEWMQIYLPGRSAEITDPLLCLIMALLLWTLELTPRYTDSLASAKARSK